jgi:hypothetical protein
MEQKKDMKNCWTKFFFLGGGEGNFLLLITHMGIVMVVLFGCWSQFFMRHLKPKKKINQTNVSEKEQMDPIIQISNTVKSVLCDFSREQLNMVT